MSYPRASSAISRSWYWWRRRLALRRHWFKARALALVWTLPIFSTAVALTSWGSWRFRMPADIGIIVLSASLQEASNRKCAVDTRI